VGLFKIPGEYDSLEAYDNRADLTPEELALADSPPSKRYEQPLSFTPAATPTDGPTRGYGRNPQARQGRQTRQHGTERRQTAPRTSERSDAPRRHVTPASGAAQRGIAAAPRPTPPVPDPS
jgi:hypothetical protein